MSQKDHFYIIKIYSCDYNDYIHNNAIILGKIKRGDVNGQSKSKLSIDISNNKKLFMKIKNKILNLENNYYYIDDLPVNIRNIYMNCKNSYELSFITYYMYKLDMYDKWYFFDIDVYPMYDSHIYIDIYNEYDNHRDYRNDYFNDEVYNVNGLLNKYKSYNKKKFNLYIMNNMENI